MVRAIIIDAVTRTYHSSFHGTYSFVLCEVGDIRRAMEEGISPMTRIGTNGRASISARYRLAGENSQQ